MNRDFKQFRALLLFLFFMKMKNSIDIDKHWYKYAEASLWIASGFGFQSLWTSFFLYNAKASPFLIMPYIFTINPFPIHSNTSPVSISLNH